MGEPKDHWSDCGQIFFHYGKGYGLTDSLETICLGDEDDIKKFLETGELNNEFHSTQRQVLKAILDYRKEQGIGTRKTDMVGTGTNGIAGSEQKAVSPATPRKRLAMRSSHKKHNYLLRR